MKKDYSVTSLTGVLIWAAAVVLRRLSLPDTGIIGLLLAILPKFGVIWLIVGLTVTFWPYLAKKEFPVGWMYPLFGVSVIPALLYVILNPVIRGVGVYAWDIVACLVSACWLAVDHFFELRKQAAPGDAGDESASTD